jgi:hypothetical protein
VALRAARAYRLARVRMKTDRRRGRRTRAGDSDQGEARTATSRDPAVVLGGARWADDIPTGQPSMVAVNATA